ncbi:MAG: excinuclease ABC subunit UvrC [Candidatus Aminicenantes bacterium]|nr:excinuclease ABC subunit UvrC [Candidatus Aminicenantes bacterium]
MTAENSLKARAAELPAKPGIYFFKNAAGRVVYIGKARSLRDRVRSYFLSNPDAKVRGILRETASIDYLLTGSEKEAAFLENNYVQRHQPRFNLRLKDDKSFPYIKVTVGEKFPGIYSSRRVDRDGARYFGPFSPARRARTSIHLVNKFFRVRGCETAVFRGRKRPCLEHELKLCSAPCVVGTTSEEDYRKDVDGACLFLEGRMPELAKTLRERMEEAAREQRYEEAARWRDVLRTVEDMRDRPRTISVALEDQDVVGFAREEGRAAVHLFFMRRGKIRSSEAALVEAASEATDAEVLGGFLADFYGRPERRDIPPRLLLPFRPASAEALEAVLGGRKRRRSPLIVPRGGQDLKLVALAARNAEAHLHKTAMEPGPLEALRETIGLERPPRTIEGFDISNTGGEESVGSLVVFQDGRPAKDAYRKFRIRSVAGPNDVASLEEVIARRYRRALAEKKPLPDLVMIDGGRPQLSAARKALSALGLEDLPLVSIAKREEILFTAEAPQGIRLPRTSAALKLVQAIRDEAHRFAISYHRGRREKRSFASELDGIPGLGPKKKAALLARYDSIEAVRNAPQSGLEKLVGATAAKLLLERLGSQRSIKRSRG